MPDLFIGQEDGENCGSIVIAATSLHFHRPVRFYFAGEKGTSSRKLIRKLRGIDLEAEPKDISVRYLEKKRWLILWYPPRGKKGKRGDHYVIFVKARKGKYRIFDSVKQGPEWLTESQLKKVWYRKDRKWLCGWAIEIRDPNSRV